MAYLGGGEEPEAQEREREGHESQDAQGEAPGAGHGGQMAGDVDSEASECEFSQPSPVVGDGVEALGDRVGDRGDGRIACDLGEGGSHGAQSGDEQPVEADVDSGADAGEEQVEPEAAGEVDPGEEDGVGRGENRGEDQEGDDLAGSLVGVGGDQANDLGGEEREP
ncbi:hypothetical protein D3C86_938200 [compost metagenome]